MPRRSSELSVLRAILVNQYGQSERSPLRTSAAGQLPRPRVVCRLLRSARATLRGYTRPALPISGREPSRSAGGAFLRDRIGARVFRTGGRTGNGKDVAPNAIAGDDARDVPNCVFVPDGGESEGAPAGATARLGNRNARERSCGYS